MLEVVDSREGRVSVFNVGVTTLQNLFSLRLCEGGLKDFYRIRPPVVILHKI